MLNNSELIRNSGYWLDQIQNEVYFQLKTYMKQNNLSQKELAVKLGFSPGYISQVLNGNFNYSIKKLIDLLLAIDKIPQLQIISIDDKLKEYDKIDSKKVISLYGYSTTVNECSIFSDKLKYV